MPRDAFEMIIKCINLNSFDKEWVYNIYMNSIVDFRQIYLLESLLKFCLVKRIEKDPVKK